MPAQTCIRNVKVIWDWRNIAKIGHTFIAPADCYRREFTHGPKQSSKNSILFFRNGSEWWRLRSEFQKGLSSPHHTRKFLSDSDNITKEFVAHIRSTNATPDKVPDILPELSRLNLERTVIEGEAIG